MGLDARLQAVAGFVPVGSRVLDVGTDHAHLAIELLKTNRAVKVIASDKNSGPFEAAKRESYGEALGDALDIRLGDGLSVIEPGEADVICIAGMGGELIGSILSAAPQVLAMVTTLVLQPMGDAEVVRAWLYRHGWFIGDEALALADSHIYEIIKAERGQRPMPDPVMLKVGPVLWEKKPDLLRHHIESLLFRQRRIVAGMEQSRTAMHSRRYREAIEQIQELELRLKW